jgi:hypothetical protein
VRVCDVLWDYGRVLWMVGFVLRFRAGRWRIGV